MKSGFTLIELVIGLFISSIMLVSLYTIFYITGRVIKSSEDIVSHDIHIAILGHQLEHDIDGIFAPSSTTITTTQPSPQTANEQKPTDQKESTPKEIKDIFISANDKDGMLRTLSFITVNPLQTYHKEGPASRMVRVVYKLAPNEDKTSLILTRQESTNLDLKAFEIKGAQGIRAYELNDRIKSIEVEFKYPEQKEEKKETKEETQEQQKVAYVTVKEWTSEQQPKEKKPVPQIPQFIIFTITLWDIHHINEQTHIMSYAIPSFSQKKAPQEKKPQQKPNQAPNATQVAR